MSMNAETQRTTDADADAARLYPMIDRLFFLFLALELLASIFFAPLAVAFAGLSLFTRVRTSRWRVLVLFSLALLIVVLVMAPFIPGFQPLNVTHEGPEQLIE